MNISEYKEIWDEKVPFEEIKSFYSFDHFIIQVEGFETAVDENEKNIFEQMTSFVKARILHAVALENGNEEEKEELLGKAKEEYENVLKENPEHEDAQYNLGSRLV